jgi:hypothetical protein
MGRCLTAAADEGNKGGLMVGAHPAASSFTMAPSVMTPLSDLKGAFNVNNTAAVNFSAAASPDEEEA